MHKNKKKALKEITEELVISFFFAALWITIIYFSFAKQINNYLSIINMITITPSDSQEIEKISFDTVQKKLANYPKWGTIFATIEISDVGINLPVYHGDTLDILKYGAGHFSGSLFPGEGGSIILDAHNDRGYFHNLPNVKIGTKVNLKTDYGTYIYQVYDTKIIGDKNMDDMPIQYEKEILMLYTCYPVNTIGHKNHRFVAYAELVGENHEK